MRPPAILLLLLLLFVMYLSSCGRYRPTIYEEQVIKIENYFGVDVAVYDDLIFYVEPNRISVLKKCAGKSDVACSVLIFSAVVIREDLAENCIVLTHELLHFALEKVDRKGNKNHSHPIWKTYQDVFCGGFNEAQ